MRVTNPYPLPIRLARLGGVATRAGLRQLGTRDEIESALAAGGIVRLARGRYALPTGTAARISAHRLSGVAVELSAAAHWGWSTTWQPHQPVVAVPRGRRVGGSAREAATTRWRTYPPGELVDGWVTTPLRTVLDCATSLPFAEGLAVADSALRSRMVSRRDLGRAVGTAPLRGRAALGAVVRCADGRAANPFESTVRAVALQVPGLVVVPQGASSRDVRGGSSATSTSLTRPCASSSRRTATSSTPTRSSSRGTACATTSSWSTTGWCCGWPGSTR